MNECSRSWTGFALGTDQEEHQTDLIFVSKLEGKERQGERRDSDRSENVQAGSCRRESPSGESVHCGVPSVGRPSSDGQAMVSEIAVYEREQLARTMLADTPTLFGKPLYA